MQSALFPPINGINPSTKKKYTNNIRPTHLILKAGGWRQGRSPFNNNKFAVFHEASFSNKIKKTQSKSPILNNDKFVICKTPCLEPQWPKTPQHIAKMTPETINLEPKNATQLGSKMLPKQKIKSPRLCETKRKAATQ